jgi:hypothetical protein
MPLKVNGHEFSWTALTSVVAVIFWLATLSFKVNANGDEIQKQAETKERLVRIETRQEAVSFNKCYSGNFLACNAFI